MEKSEKVLEKLKEVLDNSQVHLESENLALSYVTQMVCPALRDVLNNLCIYKVEEPESEENDFVIHYTRITALVSMLKDAYNRDKKSSFRLYDSVHLNDPDEGEYFTRKFELPKKYDWLGKRDLGHAYIASFIIPNSEEDLSNKLLFWRTYGEEGEGCSLSLPIPRNKLQKVLYGPGNLKRTIKELKSVLDLLDPLITEIDNPPIQEQLAATVWESLGRIRYLHKDDAYEYEKECRFVIAESDIPDKDKIFFEDKDLNNFPIRIRHYYEHEDLEIVSLLATGSSVRLGPRVPHIDNVCYYLNALRQRAGLAPQEIKISKIPYRKF